MSVTIMSRVFWTKIPSISYNTKDGKKIGVDGKSAKLALLAIADNADDFGENSWQSFETLETKTGLERRSVIRVIHALLANDYCKLAGISRYGTNDYSINVAKLGHPPEKRKRAGGQMTSDSGAMTSDSGAMTSDPESPESSLPINNQQPVLPKHQGKDLVDGLLELSQSPGIKRQARVDAILSYIGVRLKINAETKAWRTFAERVDSAQRDGQMANVFFDWLLAQKGFDLGYWPPAKMWEHWPRAFAETDEYPTGVKPHAL